ncbi:chromatin modification-related protein EAF7-domain-containing protein [Mortierella sp. GBAus27b]|nr:hypothetical protein BGX31_010814 [Mortierella sp. GBA43]KAI8361076.1 chromatin modification-related protein EAF7-domain-containing protein [Mortierella sp. GBAus27b]
MLDEEMKTADNKWDETMEMALFNAIIKYKPVGMHKHFRMINLHRHFNKHSSTPCTIAELWEKLGTMYNLQTLDEREDSSMMVEEEEEEAGSDDEQDISFKNSEEFVLPFNEFDHLVSDGADPSRNPSPSPVRTTKANREGSMTPSVADSSRASSPDDDEGSTAPKKRRTSRVPKKSDVNEVSTPKTSSATPTSTSSTRRTTRAKPDTTPVTRGRKTGRK